MEPLSLMKSESRSFIISVSNQNQRTTFVYFFFLGLGMAEIGKFYPEDLLEKLENESNTIRSFTNHNYENDIKKMQV